MFPAGKVRIDLPAKEWILGVALGGAAKAYVLEHLPVSPGKNKDRIGERNTVIEASPKGEIVSVRNTIGEMVPHMFVYWFAWQAFYS